MAYIYETKGKAREYAPLSLNLYTGCSHGCKYCYAPLVLKKSREEFLKSIHPRKNILEQITKEAPKYKNSKEQILLSFSSDPYQPIEKDCLVTRQAIEILGENSCNITVLTKGGTLACRDFRLFKKYNVSFGTTLVFNNEKKAAEWEPYAASVIDRKTAIWEAYQQRIETWVSIEPVIDPNSALSLIEELNISVHHWKIGKINYNKELEDKVDWYKFSEKLLEVLNKYKANYYIKDSLKPFLPK